MILSFLQDVINILETRFDFGLVHRHKEGEVNESAGNERREFERTPKEHLQRASSHRLYPHKLGRTLTLCSLPSLRTHLEISKPRLIPDTLN